MLHKYRAVIALGSIALLAELGYAVMNFSALPVFVPQDQHIRHNFEAVKHVGQFE